MSESRLPRLRPLGGGALLFTEDRETAVLAAADPLGREELLEESGASRAAVVQAARAAVQIRDEAEAAMAARSLTQPRDREADGARAEAVETELRAFCRGGELVYAAVVDEHGAVGYSVCTVGARPHNEAQIGELVGKVFATARLLGTEVGERGPQGLILQGARWSYSLDPVADGLLLFGIFSSRALPGIVRACAQKIRPSLEKSIKTTGEIRSPQC